MAAKSCLEAFFRDDKQHGIQHDPRKHRAFNIMAFISNVSYSAGKGQIWKTGIPLKSCQLEGFWLEDGPHKPWFEEGFLLE